MLTIRKPVFGTMVLLVIVSLVVFMSGSRGGSLLGNSVPLVGKMPVAQSPPAAQQPAKVKELVKDELQQAPIVEPLGSVSDEFAETPFMPKMANETLKAQLGNAGWRLLHTILARYPDKPTTQEQATLKQYIHLFAKVYPCGDCARHFQKLLELHPPQVSSRKTAALWGCHVHNLVNQRLGKPDYDCTTILEDYDCGCGADEEEADETLNGETIGHLKEMKVENEGRQQG